MRWLISTTAMPCSRNRRRRSSTSATCRTLIAAVGSSIRTILARDRCVRAMATAWRWPPDIMRTFSRRARFGFQLVEQLTRALVHGAVVENAERAEAAHLLARQEDVGRCRQVVAQREVLIDDLDAGGARIDRLVEMDRPAFQQHLAARRREIAGDDLDQRRLAGAVVAHEPDNLAAVEREIDLRQAPRWLRNAWRFPGAREQPPILPSHRIALAAFFRAAISWLRKP